MLKFVEGENPLISILKFLKPVSCHKLKINLFVICCEKWKLYFRFNYIFLIACEVCMCMLLRKEWGVRVCGDVILFDFWCSFAEIFFKLPYWDFTKPEAVCGNFNAVFLHYFGRCLYVFLCSFVVLMSPLCFPLPRKPKKMADRVRLS